MKMGCVPLGCLKSPDQPCCNPEFLSIMEPHQGNRARRQPIGFGIRMEMNSHTRRANKAGAVLTEMVRRQKMGEPSGIYSVCSANRYVLEAALMQAANDRSPVLIESTSNQVNQDGGYMGMNPGQFASHLSALAKNCDLSGDQVILGGDHLGPNVWKDEPEESAMQKARQLLRDCVLAGYTKLHLDASMKLGDDSREDPLDPEVSANRSADLCQAAEQAHAEMGSPDSTLYYVIGTEVPPPGGIQGEEGEIAVTRVEDAAGTIQLTRAAFIRRGLEAAWERVIALVVQPGVEYGNSTVHEYDRDSAANLSRFISNRETLVFEAHSTDYQPREALKQLVEDQFAILKIGPALTFAFREAVLALEMMEKEWLAGRREVKLSDLRKTLEQAMAANPEFWEGYYPREDSNLKFSWIYSLSDRLRYYWPVPEVITALQQLVDNLSAYPVPLPLLSQFLPVQYERVREGLLPYDPRAWIHHKIQTVLGEYAYACGMEG
jgi:D-tagatose-1,6-bisphosphate aldolase subunit GatZ/KbaZ